MPIDRNTRQVLRVSKDNTAKLAQALSALVKDDLLLGFPQEKEAVRSDDGKTPITNAALGYIHDKGAPEQNIPARPFMLPGVEDARDGITRALSGGLRAVIAGGGVAAASAALIKAGLRGQMAIRKKINEGIAPPLSERTLQARASRGRKGARQELENRQAGLPASTALAKPLVDTAQMRNAVNFAVRSRKEGV